MHTQQLSLCCYALKMIFKPKVNIERATPLSMLGHSPCWEAISGIVWLGPANASSGLQQSSAVHYDGSLLPRARMRSKGLCDWSWCLYISLHFFLEPIFYLPKYSLSEVYFNTDRLLIFSSNLMAVWYSLATRQVFVTLQSQ